MDIGDLELQVKASSGQAIGGIDNLRKSLERLKSVTKGGVGLTSVGTGLRKVALALNAIDSEKIGKIREIADALNMLKSVKASGFTSAVNTIQKIPDALKRLDSIGMDKIRSKMYELASAMEPLAIRMDAVARGFSAMPTKLQRYIREAEKVPKVNGRVVHSFTAMSLKFSVAFLMMRRAIGIVASWITESNKYIENLNLFTASMGEYAEEAHEYAETVGEIMGIDPGEWMRNQGVFMTLATGFGVANDRAYTMSKNLTQLGYDLSSFFNISVQDAMQKVQSGLSGELEPLRRLGYDLSQAKLEAVALSLGIDKTYRSMTQAEKSQLRYVAMMQQVTTAQGDMSRTLDAPANQLRILKAQVTQAARALGNIFIPALNAVLPYAIALAKAIRVLASSLAQFLGFTLPDVDYSKIEGVSGSAREAEESIDGANGAAEKLRKTLLGIDELNVLPEKSSGGGGGGGGAEVGGGFSDFDLPEYEFISSAVSQRVDEIKEKMLSSSYLLIEGLKVIGQFFSYVGEKIEGLVQVFFPDFDMSLSGVNDLISELSFGVLDLGDVVTTVGGIAIFGKWGLAIEGLKLTVEGLGWLFGDQTDKMIKDAEETRDKTVAYAEAQYKGVLHQAEYMLETGQITKEQYDEMVSAAELARDNTIAAANEQYTQTCQTAEETGSRWGEFWTNFKETATNKLEEWDKESKKYWDGVKQDISESWEGILEDLKNFWPRVHDSVSTAIDEVGEYFHQKWEDLKNWWKNLELPEFKIKTPHISWSTTPAEGWKKSVLEALGLPGEIPHMSVNWYAHGGFPDEGQMFVAREAGPELVGTIGGRTAVANNDQIVAGISAGVYSAVRSAMEDSGRETHVTAKVNEGVLFDAIVSEGRKQSVRNGYNPLLEV